MRTGTPIGPPRRRYYAHTGPPARLFLSIQANDRAPASSICTDGPTRLFTLCSVVTFGTKVESPPSDRPIPAAREPA